MDPTSVDTKLTAIEARQHEILKKLDRGKDLWDKFSILTTFVASVLLVIIGGLYTSHSKKADDAEQKRFKQQQTMMQQDQIRLQELQAVAALMPYLSSADENTRKQAFLALNTLAPTGVGIRLAELDGSPAALASLRTIVVSPVTRADQKASAERVLLRLRPVPDGQVPRLLQDTVPE